MNLTGRHSKNSMLGKFNRESAMGEKFVQHKRSCPYLTVPFGMIPEMINELILGGKERNGQNEIQDFGQ
jgi:hypothetical protein